MVINIVIFKYKIYLCNNNDFAALKNVMFLEETEEMDNKYAVYYNC